ncbi:MULTISPECIES: bifunctional 2-polyprenyl-6-hydroxyphenol methylase/3-demethylubiquinol 3-O-methyltransferase UbiG [Haloferax]|uniref:Methyltransferase domain-containing protein n=2 Tax=Haloferax TaxID=2251 RepID=A0A6G1Z4I6_9EURY|nr:MULTISPECIES: class I SAM-dependent methyltransferase [Haloferax]KAB1188610.1 class I SAM-dependent methyltransferase [Haloferax sp. CBA1149]MRW81311.1 methyltransferase domain-containing protein [Haloferax marinisediminis]
MPDDALGQAMLDRMRGCVRAQCVYRDGDDVGDAHIYEHYLVPQERWPDEKWEFVGSLRTPMLDVGCGAGQHALAVQERGDVVAFDVSPNAVRTARERGVETVFVGDMFERSLCTSQFETVLANGTQTGLVSTLEHLADLLVSLDSCTTSKGELVVDSYDPTRIVPDEFFGYRPDPRPGLARRTFHVEYGGLRGPDLEFLLLSPDRLRTAAGAAGLDVEHVHYPTTKSSYYRARIR